MHLDTHVLVWLHAGRKDELPSPVQAALDAEPLEVSPMALLELDLLHEIGRTAGGGAQVLGALGRSIGLTVSSTAFPKVAAAATGLTWTRDPFDRLICAQALVESSTLLTRDRRIRAHLDAARWD